MYIKDSEQREVVYILEENGPMSHAELTSETGIDWKKMQKIIRVLRNNEDVAITLDRRYEVKED